MNIPAKIKGIEFSVPELVITNDNLSEIVETSDEWITQRTGIAERRVVSGDEDEVTLGVAAVKKIVESTKIDPKTVDLIISASSTPHRAYPSVACEVQAAIEADNAAAFDIVAACSGFLYGLSIAKAYISSGLYKRIIVLAADATSKYVDWTDRTTCILFGDGASAMLLEAGNENDTDDLIHINIAADGKNKEFISLSMRNQNCPLAVENQEPASYHITMSGRDVYKYVMKKIPETIEKTLKEVNMTIDDIDYFIPHQANLRMIEALSERIGISKEKTISNVQKYGNISAASIPCAIKEALNDGSIKKPAILLLSAFGAGMTSACGIIRLG